MDILLQFEGPVSGTWQKDPSYKIAPNGEVYMFSPSASRWIQTVWANRLQELINKAYAKGFRLVADYKTFAELQMKYGVSIPYTVPKNLNVELKYEVKTTPKQCVHEFVDYTGFIEQFTYCRKCDVRK